ncbi:Flp pilus assembly protein CpaB [Phytohabitans aurantiacus]|uniref:Flp pilus assembly protein RcpC/CpaB domain-containing protein n=1 Tax=Phytohabitans aurantiacus TaxID=3016789 RepID=A0ABQ5QLT0_9ACTN|nr:RcpC/CpaB family pilus assembly protein [Phytohabitans aurantiacus]GLH95192.1 hypothetical protein Pa4123_04640 [Phytohabitans aurantiacus]
MTRRILAVFLAIVLAVLGTAAVLFYVSRADDRAVADASPVEVLVAKQRIPAGTTGENVRKRDLAELMRMPAGTLPEGEVLTEIPGEIDKLVLTSDLQPGQLVLRRMFSESTRTSGGLAIPEGKVAVSFEATMAEQVAGYVRPGSQVAVFVSYKIVPDSNIKSIGTESNDDPEGTSVLLPKTEVIAVGSYGGDGETTTTPRDEEVREETDSERRTVVLVTVAVSDVEAAKVIHAAQGDALYLALLSDSSQVKPGTGVDSFNFLR